MTRKLEDASEFPDKPETLKSKPKKENPLPISANQLWRDKLNEKLLSQQKGHKNAPRNTAANTGKPFGNSSPGSTARKAKKGHRSG